MPEGLEKISKDELSKIIESFIDNQLLNIDE
jgi:hypothetical protein